MLPDFSEFIRLATQDVCGAFRLPAEVLSGAPTNAPIVRPRPVGLREVVGVLQDAVFRTWSVSMRSTPDLRLMLASRWRQREALRLYGKRRRGRAGQRWLPSTLADLRGPTLEERMLRALADAAWRQQQEHVRLLFGVRDGHATEGERCPGE